MKNLTHTLALLFLTMTYTLAQSTICGSMIDKETGEAIIFANIVVEGTSIGVNSDMDGKFCIDVPQDATELTFSYVGYETQTLKIKDLSEKEVIIKMQEAAMIMESIIITGSKDTYRSEAVPSPPSVTSHEMRNMSLPKPSKAPKKSRSKGKKRATAMPAPLPSDYEHYSEYSLDDSYISDETIIMDKVSARDTKKDRKESAKVKPEKEVQARQLTAGEVHDFSKWDLWQDITADQLAIWQKRWKIKPTERYTLQAITQSGAPIIDATTRLLDANQKTVWTAKTDNTGKAELWANLFTAPDSSQTTTYTIAIDYENKTHTIANATTFQKGINTFKIDENCDQPNHIDIAFVVDATGSMGDEIDFLKAELLDVMQQVKADHKKLDLNLGSVFYRDHGDDYLTRHSDLSNKLEKTVSFIKAQKAGGGGDTPEAADEALDVAINTLQWSDKAVARLLFLVLDAPPHYNDEVLARIQSLSLQAATKGIRIIPITGSGIDKSTEYLMRSLALATNGTYTFLTDDSGIGNPHIKPTTDEYKVELLNDLLLRLIHQFVEMPECTSKQQVANNKKDNIKEIDEKLQDILQFYPNPTHGDLTIEIKEGIKDLYIADLTGKILERRTQLQPGKHALYLGDYPSGVYFIKYPNGEDKWLTGKIVLVH